METAVKVLAWQHGVILVFLAMLKTNLRQFKDGYRRQSIKKKWLAMFKDMFKYMGSNADI